MIIILDEIPDRIDTYHTKAPFYHKLQRKDVKGSLKKYLSFTDAKRQRSSSQPVESPNRQSYDTFDMSDYFMVNKFYLKFKNRHQTEQFI